MNEMQMKSLDDISLARVLERETDDLLLSKDPAVVQKGLKAKELLKGKKLEGAAKLVMEAQAEDKPVPLVEVLATKGGLGSRAAARRLVAQSAVRIDGKVARNADADTRGVESIKVKRGDVWTEIQTVDPA